MDAPEVAVEAVQQLAALVVQQAQPVRQHSARYSV